MAIVKFDTVMQVEDIGAGVGDLPAFGESWSDVQVFVAGEEVVEDQVVDAFGIGVDPDAGIEVGGAAFDDHYKGFKVGRRRAGGERQ